MLRKSLICPSLVFRGQVQPYILLFDDETSNAPLMSDLADPPSPSPAKASLPDATVVSLPPLVPTVGMTRLVRSRTHSASSVGSTDGSRSRGAAATLPEDTISPSPEHSAMLTIEMTA